jgi:hypothetical protein
MKKDIQKITESISKFCGSVFVNLRFHLNCRSQGRARAPHAPSFFAAGPAAPPYLDSLSPIKIRD